MALPDSRNRTYAPNSQVYAEDLNAIQDSIVRLADKEIYFYEILEPNFFNFGTLNLKFNCSTKGDSGPFGDEITSFAGPDLTGGRDLSIWEITANICVDQYTGTDTSLAVNVKGGFTANYYSQSPTEIGLEITRMEKTVGTSPTIFTIRGVIALNSEGVMMNKRVGIFSDASGQDRLNSMTLQIAATDGSYDIEAGSLKLERIY